MDWREKHRRQNLAELASLERQVKETDFTFSVRCSASRHHIRVDGGRLLLLSHRAGLEDKNGDAQGGQEAEDILSLLGGSDGKADANDRCRCKEIRFWWEQYTSATAGRFHEKLCLWDHEDEHPWLRQEIKGGYFTPSEILAKIPKSARETAMAARRISDLRNDHYLDFRSLGPLPGMAWKPGESVATMHGKLEEKAIPKHRRHLLRTGDNTMFSARIRYAGRWEKDRAFSTIYQGKVRRILGLPAHSSYMLSTSEQLTVRRKQHDEWWRVAAEKHGFVACRFPSESQWEDGFPPAATGYVKDPQNGERMQNVWAVFHRDENGEIQVRISGVYKP